jgi:hypothetical protein
VKWSDIFEIGQNSSARVVDELGQGGSALPFSSAPFRGANTASALIV